MFQNFYETTRNDVLPNCPQCGRNDALMMIDHTKEQPVWHCDHCSKIFGDRTCVAESVLMANSGYSSNVTMHVKQPLDPSDWTDQGNVAQMIGTALQNHRTEAYTLKVEMEHIALTIANKQLMLMERQINERLNETIKYKQDPLTEIRERVAKFVLRY